MCIRDSQCIVNGFAIPAEAHELGILEHPALVVDEVCEPQLADQVRRAKKDGLIDGFFYSSVSSDYLRCV